ncbi:hypothetical protein MMC22_000526 [Lobaria immixta]|nr:hypothetical protein [Lobaria immixta]
MGSRARSRQREERNRRPSVLTRLTTTPFRQFSSPIREIYSPFIQLSARSIQKAVNRTFQKAIDKTKTPASQSEIRRSIRQVDFHDPGPVVELASKLEDNGRRKAPIDIGKHRGDKTYSYSIHFGARFFPADFECDPTRPKTGLTYIKCNNPSLPALVLQLGQLRYTCVSDSDLQGPLTSESDPTDTFFVIVVDIMDRMAWALWNPDEFDAIDGVLPGFEKACIAIPLNQTIDELLANSSTQDLDLNPENFLTMPQRSEVGYGGVDEEGWKILSTISSKYKRASNVRTRISR